jgi:hypothetical protein
MFSNLSEVRVPNTMCFPHTEPLRPLFTVACSLFCRQAEGIPKTKRCLVSNDNSYHLSNGGYLVVFMFHAFLLILQQPVKAVHLSLLRMRKGPRELRCHA